MLQSIIEFHKDKWLNSDECTVRSIIDYIKNKGQLREAQYRAIETYLFLKIKGQNKPLWQLFAEGFFSNGDDLSKLNINQTARVVFENNKAAKSLLDFTRFKVKNGNGTDTLLPDLEKYIINNSDKIDYKNLIKRIFYGIDYSDYLFSLPMGAGKTFLMASIIYLDLYFALNEPENKNFAHNFIILVPSGLKSSIVPSIKTIEKFDPTWIIPEPSASKLKNLIKFEILDQPKTGKKSNKARNPNAQKVNNYQPFEELMGLVMVVNAEKVILDRLELTAQGELFEKTEDEKDKQANELRNIISKIPNLQIHIDEVHHAATDDIKLRKVVTKWNLYGNINSVLGYSGTPYLSKKDEVIITEKIKIKFSQITNTVFYYPLTIAIKKFLKKPRVEQVSGLTSLQIIKKGIDDFFKNYNNTVYDNGTIAKIAIYCGSTVERLETEIFPYLVDVLKIDPDIILKFHRGGKGNKFKLPKENETEFASIDTPLSRKKIILLAQIGKEGWDCRSLTGVILSQKGDCPSNMVLQTSCRCLRQVDKNKQETAIIWLNNDNAKSLDKQLKEEQHTSIEELNNLGKLDKKEMVERFSRLEFLKLPKIDFYQLKVEYNTITIDENAEPENKINSIDTKDSFNKALIVQRGLNQKDEKTKSFLSKVKGEPANFYRWLFEIAKGSFNSISLKNLMKFELELQKIFKAITVEENKKRFYNDLFDNHKIQSQIRLSFHCKRYFETKSEIIPASAQMLIVENLHSVPNNDKLYPSVDDTKKIIDTDAKNTSLDIDESEIRKAFEIMKKSLEQQGMGNLALDFNQYKSQFDFSPAIKSKHQTFHYLPYNFWQSKFELQFLKEALTLRVVKEKNLEVYYNGEKDLTDFRITCYAKKGTQYQRVGLYTPDFLIIKRKDREIIKILIIETKGSGYAEQKSFQLRKQFMESEFLQMNNDKFGYRKFEYLFLQDDAKFDDNLAKLNGTIINFFKEN
jgi:superfamily II DNA or RNA helicase